MDKKDVLFDGMRFTVGWKGNQGFYQKECTLLRQEMGMVRGNPPFFS